MPKIKEVRAREILDSRGNPTIEVDIHTERFMGRMMVPSGASTGKHEAIELRDGGKRYMGLGVKKAVNKVNKVIRDKVIGMDCRDQIKIDNTLIALDGTENKSRLGANAILAVSLAAARVASLEENTPFFKYCAHLSGNKGFIVPVPFMNVINGGLHAGNNLKFQEFMIVPHAESFAESLRIGSETYHILKKIISKKYGKTNTNLGDEGGFAPNISTINEALDLLTGAIDKAGYTKEIKIAIDAASSDFYDKKKGYCIEERCYFNEEALTDLYCRIIKEYPIISIEDPFHEEAFEEFANLTKKIGHKVKIVGDDLTVTNVKRIKKAVKLGSCNCLLLKVNQIGTLTEAIDASRLALKSRWNVMVSHRSGETEDHFISDFAVGLGTGAIKSGAPSRGERTAKYNQLLRIEERLGICYPISLFGKRLYR